MGVDRREQRSVCRTRALMAAGVGVGALLQAGLVWAGPLVGTGAFKWATSSQVRAMIAKDSGTARGSTVTYSGPVAHVVVVVPQPEFPFPKFDIDHLRNPTLVLPAGATIKFTFINKINNFSHSFQITRARPPFAMFPKIEPVLVGTELSPASGTGNDAFANFSWHPSAGHYYYLCAIPGHAKMGMFGSIIVR